MRTTEEGLRIFAYPVKEIEKLHVRERVWSDEKLEPGQNILSDIRGELFDIDAEFKVGEAGELGFVINGPSIVCDSKENELSSGGDKARLKPINGKMATNPDRPCFHRNLRQQGQDIYAC